MNSGAGERVNEGEYAVKERTGEKYPYMCLTCGCGIGSQEEDVNEHFTHQRKRISPPVPAYSTSGIAMTNANGGFPHSKPQPFLPHSHSLFPPHPHQPHFEHNPKYPPTHEGRNYEIDNLRNEINKEMTKMEDLFYKNITGNLKIIKNIMKEELHNLKEVKKEILQKQDFQSMNDSFRSEIGWIVGGDHSDNWRQTSNISLGKFRRTDVALEKLKKDLQDQGERNTLEEASTQPTFTYPAPPNYPSIFPNHSIEKI